LKTAEIRKRWLCSTTSSIC